MNKKNGGRLMSIETRRNLNGYVFILPWIIGALAFFIFPMLKASIYLFHSVKIEAGYVTTKFTGLANLRNVFLEDPDNLRIMLTSLGATMFESVLIVFFSLIMAIILTKKFRTAAFAKAVFVLPIIVSSGILLSVFRSDLFVNSSIQNSDSTIFQGVVLKNSLIKMGMSADMVGQFTSIISQIMDTVWKSGVQILLFIAGINTVSPALYEVCRVEGATGWQIFWEVTFPLMTPFILLNAIYSIVDSFTFVSNPVMQKIQAYFNVMNYEASTTFAFVYGIGILILTGVVGLVLSRRVVYVEH